MLRALKGLSLFGVLAVVLTLFFVVGCSNTPLQPEVPEVQQLELGRSPIPMATSTYDQELIEADEGGKIDIERDAYGHEFSVPKDALEATTLITVKSSAEEIFGKSVIVFEFGPDGLVFNKAATLKFEMAELNADASSAKIFYYNPLKKRWEYQASAVVIGGHADFNIDHFSKYAISD